MPRKSHQQHHYDVCPHCQGSGIKSFFQNVGNKIKHSFEKGGVMRKVGSEVANVAKPFVRPLVNDLVNTAKSSDVETSDEDLKFIERQKENEREEILRD
jgi:hypothetical protein